MTSLTHTAQAAAPVAVPDSPLQIELRFYLDLPAAEAFDLVATRLPEWFTLIHAVHWDHSRSTAGRDTPGACSERVCALGGKALREVIAEYRPGRSYAYRVDTARSELKMPMRDHLGTFELAPAGNQTLVTWRQHFRPRWYVPAAVLRWQLGERMMRPAVQRLIDRYGGRWG
ncbi:MAG: SRPBCC family protein [Deltaproteobacteria bacterium]|nr:SRPBCC family protein [Deltaproteobacteria bacterium]